MIYKLEYLTTHCQPDKLPVNLVKVFHTHITEISRLPFMLRTTSLTLFFSLASFCMMYGNDLTPVMDLPVDHLKVYPNPSATGKFTINFHVDIQEKDLNIKVHDLIGNVVYSKQLGGTIINFQDEVDLSALPKGVYLLVISNGESKQIRRLSYT